MDKRGGGVSRFSVEVFCLPVPKYFIGEHFGVSENFFYRKFSCIRAGHLGFVEIFCLTGPKRKALSRNPSVFRKFSGIEKKFMDKRGHITIFYRKFVVSQYRKTS